VNGGSGSPAGGPPVLRVVRGAPTPEELAAVIALVVARSGGAAPAAAPAPASLWSAPQLRPTLHPGPGAWRASALPH
jgi:hypothetical protein